MLEVDLDRDVLGQHVWLGGLRIRDRLTGSFPDQLLGFERMEMERRGRAQSLFDGHADALVADPLDRLGDRLLITDNQRDRHAEVAGDGGVDAELAGRAAVETHVVDPARTRCGPAARPACRLSRGSR